MKHIYTNSLVGSFVIYHVAGQDVTIDEARIQMAGFGEIETCEILPISVQDAMRIKAGVLVEYASFDPSRDVIAVSSFLFSRGVWYAVY